MSLILEALKKSEAKRRLGETPDLGTPFTTARRRSNALPLLLVAIVAAGAFGWWYLRKPAPAVDRTAVVDGTAQKTARPAPGPAVSAPAPTPDPTARMQQARTPPPAMTDATAAPTARATARGKPPLQPDASSDPANWVAVGRAGGLQNRGALQSTRKLPPNMHSVSPTTSTPAKTPPVPAAVSQIAAAAPAPAAKAPDAHGIASPPAAPTLAKAAKTPDMRGVAPIAETLPPAGGTANPVAVAPKSDVPFYYELPFNVRKALPPLHLSMHVYAGDPTQRFIILNDSRLAEGDKTSDEVTLREVRKDGAILEFQGQRFFYPREM